MALLHSLLGEDAAILKRRNYQLLLLAGVLTPLGTVLLSPILELLIDPLGASAANVGLIISFYTAPAIVLIPLAGGLADRIGRKPILIVGLLLYGSGGVAIAFTTNFRVVLALRLLQGIGVSGIGPIIITALGDLYDGPEEATAHGLRQTAGGLVGASFPIIAGVIVAIAWQIPFLLYAAAIPIAVALYVWFDEPTTGTDGDDEENGVAYLRAVVHLATRPRPFALLAARGLANVAGIGFIAYNSVLLSRLLGTSSAVAGVVFAIQATTMALAASQAGRVTLWFDDLMRPLLVTNVVLGVGLLGFAFVPGVLSASLMVTIFGIGYGLTMSLYRSVLTNVAPKELRGGYISLTESGGRVASTATPIAMGLALTSLSPMVGELGAIQLTWIAISVVGAGGGLVCVTIAIVVGEFASDVADATDPELG